VGEELAGEGRDGGQIKGILTDYCKKIVCMRGKKVVESWGKGPWTKTCIYSKKDKKGTFES